MLQILGDVNSYSMYVSRSSIYCDHLWNEDME